MFLGKQLYIMMFFILSSAWRALRGGRGATGVAPRATGAAQYGGHLTNVSCLPKKNTCAGAQAFFFLEKDTRFTEVNPALCLT